MTNLLFFGVCFLQRNRINNGRRIICHFILKKRRLWCWLERRFADLNSTTYDLPLRKRLHWKKEFWIITRNTVSLNILGWVGCLRLLACWYSVFGIFILAVSRSVECGIEHFGLSWCQSGSGTKRSWTSFVKGKIQVTDNSTISVDKRVMYKLLK